MAQRKDSDEFYVIDLCDEVLGAKASRQHKFDFLRGDGTPGRQLPVDAYYPELNLVVEYRERQHTESVALFDRKATVSGVSRGEQRRIYDKRRRDVLPKHGIRLVEISYSDLKHDSRKRLVRDRKNDLAEIRRILQSDGSKSKISSVSEKSSEHSLIYRAYEKFGYFLIVGVLAATLLLSAYLSISVFRLNDAVSCTLIMGSLFIVGLLCHHYTTAVDKRKQSKYNTISRINADFPAVCCPVCGSLNIGSIANGEYGCMACGLTWKQTY